MNILKAFTLFALVFYSFNLSAQHPEGKHHGHRGEMMEKMINSIDNLSDEQKSQIRELHKNMKPKMEVIRNDESLSREEKRKKMMSLRDEMDAEMKKILTEEQYQQLEAKRKEMRKKRGEHKRHMEEEMD